MNCHILREAVDVMDWPSTSPDLNPIEHLWDRVKRELNSPNNNIRNVADQQMEIQRIWNDIPRAAIRRLIISSRRRVEAVIVSRGITPDIELLVSYSYWFIQ